MHSTLQILHIECLTRLLQKIYMSLVQLPIEQRAPTDLALVSELTKSVNNRLEHVLAILQLQNTNIGLKLAEWETDSGSFVSNWVRLLRLHDAQ